MTVHAKLGANLVSLNVEHAHIDKYLTQMTITSKKSLGMITDGYH